MNISVIILTYNEDMNIERCLNSIKDLASEIIIVDSQSTDKTLDICEKYGCRIFQNNFINQAIQFNWALDNIDIRNDWVFRLDADEIVPKKLKKEMLERVGREEGVHGYSLNRRMYWMNKWLKHGRMYPHFIARIFKKGYGRYEEKTEEHLIIDGQVRNMKNDFLEDNRLNNLDYFTRKHLSTAEGEVREVFLRHKIDDKTVRVKFFGAKVERTRWLKLKIYEKTPLFVRPFLYFTYRYIICLGILDGKKGFIFHILQAFWYRMYIDARVFEEESNWQETKKDFNEI